MRTVLKLFVAVSWVALVPGQANAQSNVPVREAASANAGSVVTAPPAATGNEIRTTETAGRTNSAD